MSLLLLTPSANRPPKVKQPSFLPFDPSGPGGDVHTVLPPEYTILPGADREHWRGNAWGVTTTFTPHLVAGANTTPPNMWMTYLLHLYTTREVSTFLDEYCSRGLTHIHLGRESSTDLIRFCQSYGLWISAWGDIDGSTRPDTLLVQKIRATNPEQWNLLLGGELNSHIAPGPDGLDRLVANTIAQIGPANLWLHLTADMPSWQGADVSGPIQWWQKMHALGVTGLCWQANQDDPPGLMGAHLWDARWRMAQASTDLLCSAWELVGTNQLYGRANEQDGCRAAWELNCCTRGEPAPNAPHVAGTMNGWTWPDGTV
jgi:hypothetical protein